MDIYQHIEAILNYATKHLQLNERDLVYKRNTLYALFNLSGCENIPNMEVNDSAPDRVLQDLLQEAVSASLIKEEQTAEFSDVIMGLLSLAPSEIEKEFNEICFKEGSHKATEWFYDYCVSNSYVKKALLDKNPRFDADNGLIVTINKAKPEFSDPKKAKSGNSVKGGYPKCVICQQNEGYLPRQKGTLRTVDIELKGGRYFWQYSPYGYFYQHGILVNKEHTPMHVDKMTYFNLMQFVDKFPHYFIGCNAPLPRIGGSVLAHDHYQGGMETLPMFKAKQLAEYNTIYEDTKVGILDWPGTVVRITSKSQQHIVELACKLQTAWESYENASLGIVPCDSDGQHSTVSPSVVKQGDTYLMNVILRNNITTEQYPDGVFHAHPEYHAIKKESIGLIEAQGLFILPGRLVEQLEQVKQAVMQSKPLPQELTGFELVYQGLLDKGINAKHTKAQADKAINDILADICYHILQNTAVFKDSKLTEQFILSAGICTK